MPLARYFLFVGGTLLALLFVLDAYMPSPVAAGAAAAPDVDVSRPFLRIRSAQKLPERIVFDTSMTAMAAAPAPMVVAEAPAAKAVVAEAPAKIPALDALAQISPSDLKKADLKKPEPKALPKRKVARRQAHPPMIAYAQAPPRLDFDLFTSR